MDTLHDISTVVGYHYAYTAIDPIDVELAFIWKSDNDVGPSEGFASDSDDLIDRDFRYRLKRLLQLDSMNIIDDNTRGLLIGLTDDRRYARAFISDFLDQCGIMPFEVQDRLMSIDI